MRCGVKSVYRLLLLLMFFSAAAGAGVAQSLYEMPEGVESRWASGENPTGERGKAGQTNGGRKGSPTVAVKAGESRVLAEAQGASGTVRRIWMTFPDRSPRMLRSLRLDMYWDGAKRRAGADHSLRVRALLEPGRAQLQLLHPDAVQDRHARRADERERRRPRRAFLRR
jgi:hypothetical protein